MAQRPRIFISHGTGKGKSHLGQALRESLARLGEVYRVEIHQEPVGYEWYRVGEDLADAMDEAKRELPALTADELVEA